MSAMAIHTGSRDILVACGDSGIRGKVERALESGNLTCRGALDGAETLREIRTRAPDLLILDLQLPDPSGLGVCRLLRESDDTECLPIIIVSSQDSEIDRVLAFESGADDFIGSPFYAAELRARVDAVLRGFRTPRPGPARPAHVGPVAVDEHAGRIRVAGEIIDLTVREFSLLQILAANPGRVVRRRQLIEQVWRDGKAPTDRAIDAYIKSIRRKLGAARDCIETVRGVGYRLAEGADPWNECQDEADPSG